jgi:hypothetical protein
VTNSRVDIRLCVCVRASERASEQVRVRDESLNSGLIAFPFWNVSN